MDFSAFGRVIMVGEDGQVRSFVPSRENNYTVPRSWSNRTVPRRQNNHTAPQISSGRTVQRRQNNPTPPQSPINRTMALRQNKHTALQSSNNIDILRERNKEVYSNPLSGPPRTVNGKAMPRFLNSEGVQKWSAPFEEQGACDKNCKECAKHYRPQIEQILDSRVYAKDMTFEDVVSMATGFTETIFQDLEYLRTKLASHGDLLLRRWHKKSQDTRRAILLQAMPDMFETKAAQPSLHYSCDGWLAKRPFRKTWLLPYLSLEELLDDKSKLINLLFHRTTSEPQDWVMFDSEQLSNAYARGCLEVMYHPSAVKMHGPDYGKVTEWERNAAHAFNIFGWPRARLILEAQAELMGFLRRTVNAILQDCPAASGSDRWDESAAVGFRSVYSEKLCVYTNQAFSAAPRFNAAELLEIAQTRVAAGEDELQLLQTDPAYALKHLESLSKLEYFNAIPENRWRAIGHEFATPALHRAVMWRWVAQELEYVIHLRDKYQGQIDCSQAVPKEYADAVGALKTLVSNIISQQVGHLQNIVRALPGFQHLFENVEVDGELVSRPKSCAGAPDMYRRDPLSWAVARLLECDDMDSIETNKSFYFAFIDNHLSAADAEERARVDQRSYDYLTDMACMDSVLVALKFHRPNIMPIDTLVAEHMHGDRGGGTAAWRNCTKELDNKQHADLYERVCATGDALEAFIKCDVPQGTKDAAWLSKMDESRALLTKYWDGLGLVSREFLTKLGRTAEQVESEVALTRFGHSVSHIEEVAAERLAIISPVPKPLPTAPAPALIDACLGGSNTFGPRSTPDNTAKRPKQKAISHPNLAQSVHDPISSKKPSTSTPQQSAKIGVSVQSLQVFQSMFLHSSESKKPLKWKHVVTAMAESGCSIFNNGGSAVTFKHPHGSIQVHRPHPEPTVDSNILRGWGKRLQNRFGWDIGLFRQKEKTTTIAEA